MEVDGAAVVCMAVDGAAVVGMEVDGAAVGGMAVDGAAVVCMAVDGAAVVVVGGMVDAVASITGVHRYPFPSTAQLQLAVFVCESPTQLDDGTVSGAKHSALALQDPHIPAETAVGGNPATPRVTTDPLILLQRWYNTPPPVTTVPCKLTLRHTQPRVLEQLFSTTDMYPLLAVMVSEP